MQGISRGAAFAGVPLRTRIGINTGEVIAGTVGAGYRHNHTAHGPVNVYTYIPANLQGNEARESQA